MIKYKLYLTKSKKNKINIEIYKNDNQIYIQGIIFDKKNNYFKMSSSIENYLIKNFNTCRNDILHMLKNNWLSVEIFKNLTLKIDRRLYNDN